MKRLASGVFLVTRSFADGFRLFATGLVLAAVLRVMPRMDDAARALVPVARIPPTSILILSVLVIGVATIIYTYHGGMTAVIWTDVIQLGRLPGRRVDRRRDPARARFRAAGRRCRRSPGAGRQVPLFDFTFSAHAELHVLVGRDRRRVPDDGDARHRPVDGAALLLREQRAPGARGAALERRRRASCSSCCSCSSARCCTSTTRSTRRARSPSFMQNGRLQTDRIFPYFIVRHLPPGVVGLVLAAIFAAAMSTLSSSLNSSSAAAVNDFYMPATGGRRDDRHYLNVSRVAHGRLRAGPDRRGDRRHLAVEPRRGRSARHRVVHQRRHPRRVPARHVHARVGQRSAFVGIVGGSAIMLGDQAADRGLAGSGTCSSARSRRSRSAGRAARDRRRRVHREVRAAIVMTFAERRGRSLPPAWRTARSPPRRSKSDGRTGRSGATRSAASPTTRTPRQRSEDTIFDLASLTKVDRDDDAGDARRRRRGARARRPRGLAGCRSGAARIARTSRIRDLLEHASGLPAYLPFFRDHTGRAEFEPAICRAAARVRAADAGRSTATSDSSCSGSSSRTRAACGGITACSIRPHRWRRSSGGLASYLSAGPLTFNPPRLRARASRPTEMEEWRGRTLVGEVHDENAWALGGAAGHAGLFGTAAGGRRVRARRAPDARRRPNRRWRARHACARSSAQERPRQLARARAGTRCCPPRRAARACPHRDRAHRLHRHVALD